jgi:hypothetical protein
MKRVPDAVRPGTASNRERQAAANRPPRSEVEPVRLDARRRTPFGIRVSKNRFDAGSKRQRSG